MNFEGIEKDFLVDEAGLYQYIARFFRVPPVSEISIGFSPQLHQ